MGLLTAGTVGLVRFPFSDLSRTKLRPAVVVADAGRGDWVLCQITSKPYGDPSAISIGDSDFASGSLSVASFVRPGKLFTASEELVLSAVGILKREGFEKIVESIILLLRCG